jgi:hypothetical protein
MSRHSCIFRMAVMVVLSFLFSGFASAQQTLGGITGLVTDAQSSLVSGATVTVTGDQTGLTRTQVSGSNGRSSPGSWCRRTARRR